MPKEKVKAEAERWRGAEATWEAELRWSYGATAPRGREALGREEQGGADQASPVGGFGEGIGSECGGGVGRRGQERTERTGGKEESRKELFLGTKKIR